MRVPFAAGSGLAAVVFQNGVDIAGFGEPGFEPVDVGRHQQEAAVIDLATRQKPFAAITIEPGKGDGIACSVGSHDRGIKLVVCHAAPALDLAAWMRRATQSWKTKVGLSMTGANLPPSK